MICDWNLMNFFLICYKSKSTKRHYSYRLTQLSPMWTYTAKYTGRKCKWSGWSISLFTKCKSINTSESKSSYVSSGFKSAFGIFKWRFNRNHHFSNIFLFIIRKIQFDWKQRSEFNVFTKPTTTTSKTQPYASFEMSHLQCAIENRVGRIIFGWKFL